MRIPNAAAARLAVALGLIGAACSAPVRAAGETVLFRNATIWTMAGGASSGILTGADLLIRDGKIVAVGKSLTAPAGARVQDMTGQVITPGIIDCHSHTAVDGDVNEGSDNVTSEVRIKDVLEPDDINIYRELAGGTTVANVLHGSANSIGGQTQVIKLRWGQPASELPFEGAIPGIKFALGENPKQSNWTREGGLRYPATRMGVEASIRTAFLEARDYQREWADWSRLGPKERARKVPPRRDLQKEALVEVLEGKRLVHCHSYRQDEILMMIRLADEFGFRIGTFQHVLEGYKVADEIARHGAGASTFSDWWAYKFEVYDAIGYNGTIMARRGVTVSFNSDSNELARRLNLETAKAVRYGGLGEEDAFAFVTINPARQLRIDARVGSIEPGKDADLAVWNGHPMSTGTICLETWVDGIKRFDRALDIAGRDTAAKARAALIERIKAADVPAPSATPAPAQASAAAAPATPAAAQPGPRGLAWKVTRAWPAKSFALTGATVHPVSGPDIPNGTIVVKDGRVAAVGAGVVVPPGIEVIALDGLHVYPGMIDANSVLGLTEIGAVRATNDYEETGALNPQVRTEAALNPDSELLPVTRAGGVTHVLAAPQGGLVSGTSALVRLDGWTWEDMTAGAPAGMHVQFPGFFSASTIEELGSPAREDSKKAREKQMKQLKELLAGARAYRLGRQAPEGTPGRAEADPSLEAMVPVVEGREPVFVTAHERRQIRAAVEWAKQEKLLLVIVGGDEAPDVAGLLRDNGVPVILGPVLTLPGHHDDPYDAAYSVAARLHAAGVRYCISGGGSAFSASSARNLPFHAAMAASYGLPRDEALKAITQYPAEILGAGADLGTIETGKSADLIVTSGDPLDIRTQILRVFIDGKPADLTNRQTRLNEKYSARPRPVD